MTMCGFEVHREVDSSRGILQSGFGPLREDIALRVRPSWFRDTLGTVINELELDRLCLK